MVTDPRVVVARLYGGLGNQMFQYAAGLSVAGRLGASLHLDTEWFNPRAHPPDSPPQRHYALGTFGITPGVPLRDRLLLKVRRPTIVREARLFTYQPELESVSGSVVLDGYWQSFRYFDRIADDVRKVFRFPEPTSAAARRLILDCARPNSVAIHVRRGDYVENQKLERIFGSLPGDYYEAAVQEIHRRRGADLHLVVFSDDIEWCRRSDTFRHLGRTSFVAETAADHEDMQLMSLCQNHVIANSSFSWWAAWLANSPDKVVVAPTRWLNDPAVDTSDLLPPTWLRL